MPREDKAGGGGPPPPTPVDLSAKAQNFHISPPLRERVATEVLKYFKTSLYGTLAFATLLILIDSIFIATKTITPEQRLMTERIIMTFVSATVVQVGAALAAIVFAVFKTQPKDADPQL